jgi:predicted transcriptional regulator
MPRRKSKNLTVVELEIMQVVWDRGEVSVEDIQEALTKQGRELAPSSVRTMLSILGEKGYVSRKKAGRGYVYRARVSREKARRSIVAEIVQRAFDGSALGLVAALLDTRMVSKQDVEEVKRLLREREKEVEE